MNKNYHALALDPVSSTFDQKRENSMRHKTKTISK